VTARAFAWVVVLSSAAAVVFAAVVWFVAHPNGLPQLSAARDGAMVLGWGLLGVAWGVTGAALVARRPRNAIGWLLLAVGTCQAWHVGLVAYGIFGLTVVTPAWPGALWAGYAGAALLTLGLLATPTLLLALYPEGRLPARWWRWPVAAAVVAMLHLTAQGLFPVLGDPKAGEVVVVVPDFLQGVPPSLLPPVYRTSQPAWTTGEPLPAWVSSVRDGYLPLTEKLWVPLYVLTMLLIWAGTAVRLARSRPPQRQQLAWLVCVVMPFLVAAWLAPKDLGRLVVLPTLLLVPVAVAVGVLRYRLLGIEAAVRRGAVYAVLTALVFAIYLGAAVLLTNVAIDRQLALPGVLAAVLVVVGLAPARERVQRAVDRILYGERRDPLAAMTQFGNQMAISDELDLLPAALRTVTHAVRAPGAAVIAPDGELIGRAGADLPNGARYVSLPLEFGGQVIGELRVSNRGAHDAYSRPEHRLLSALAHQVAVIVRALGLAEALEAERDRAVTAIRTERDRLRSDMHDGLGPSLSGVGLGLQALADAPDDPDRAAALLDRLRAEVATAVGEVRRIIDGLRPAALDTMGLTEAIRCHADTVSTFLPVDVDIASLPPLPPDVETAAYRITTEALTNALRHAGAHHVRVCLDVPDGALRITVADDGHGVLNTTAGVGLTSMRRRAEALGGRLELASVPTGTTVITTFPLEAR
jgi:signal transduction histidine kinase